MRRFIFITASAWMLIGIGATAETVLLEDFPNPAKPGNSGATSEPGNGGSYTL